MMIDDQVIEVGELCQWIPISRRTITTRLREDRDLPPHFRLGRKILFRKSLLMAWIEAQEAKPSQGGETP
ncbi:MAG: helix-turn-helix transcriptional regulator [Isosphaeraceae bacterium]